MADTKITDLAALTGDNVATTDKFVVVDVSDSTMAASGTDKSVTADELAKGMGLRLRYGSIRPTGALYDTYDRSLGASNQGTLTSGTLKMVGIHLPINQVIASITWHSATTPLSGGSHAWSALFDSSLALLRQSTDDGAPTWAANSAKTFTLSSTFTTTYTGFHYIGLLIAATVPTLACHAEGSGISNIYALPPILVGNSTTGLVGTAPNPAAAITASIVIPYAYVS